ncbi:MAG: hypothetical protein COX30_02205 [Candidatus Moranbacteria bacterium CG23_combo_of_CG06-09_8_20_14_all_39_10]|nr:MAG: hypothetical protein COX30_02205 [Candidatus Moranbacteria bacterium CG23_combo_of_CG06-09_8_20_14_all_39_10]
MNKELINFILKAKKSTYANAEDDSKKILSDGSKEFTYADGSYSYRDRYFGSDPFTGQEVVFFNNKAVWIMNYHGYILDKTVSESIVYNFLKRALMKVSESAPFRGPAKFIDGDYQYASEFMGNPTSFSGIETIYFKNKKIYELYFHGGVIA